MCELKKNMLRFSLSVEQVSIDWRSRLSSSNLRALAVLYQHIIQVFPGLDLMFESSQYMDADIFGETGTWKQINTV